MRFLVALVCFPLLCWAEPATVVRVTELKKDPATDAPTVATLAENTTVDALERQGGWTRVKSGSAEGWVRMLSLRLGGPGQAKQGDTGVSQLFNVARTGTSGAQVTTGVRGLDPDRLANPQPDRNQLSRMQSYAVSPEAAASFAAQGRLQQRRVQEVP